MKLAITSFILLSVFFFFTPHLAHAVEDPFAVANNKFGIHILFDSELLDASRLINSSGGDWGYVTIPIQAGDQDLAKWQHFMDLCRDLHIIPIIRLATEGDYFNTTSWRKPDLADVLDFANFLNSLDWPTKNRYVVIFNEVNRGDEWGGTANPAEYADILHFASDIFKSKNSDFFIISSGMDNAAPNQGTDFIDEYTFYRQMHEADPDIFTKIDGFASHAYPNPGFSQPPSVTTRKSIASFVFEQRLLESLGAPKLPVFITETGWSANEVDDAKRAEYYKEAFSGTWSDPSIVAITPFLLRAGDGPFKHLSFLQENGDETEQYKAYQSMEKVKGQPLLGIRDLGIANVKPIDTPSKNFLHDTSEVKHAVSLSVAMQTAFKWIMKLN